MGVVDLTSINVAGVDINASWTRNIQYNINIATCLSDLINLIFQIHNLSLSLLTIPFLLLIIIRSLVYRVSLVIIACLILLVSSSIILSQIVLFLLTACLTRVGECIIRFFQLFLLHFL